MVPKGGYKDKHEEIGTERIDEMKKSKEEKRKVQDEEK